MTCRSLSLIDPELRHRWHLVDRDWRLTQRRNPRLIVTGAWRTRAEQEALYARGRTSPGAIVTNAPPGTSLHEYGLALDFGFVDDVLGKMDWAECRFHQLGAIAEKYGLRWGGRFQTPDLPHVQAPCSWQRALAGETVQWPPLGEPRA